MSVQIHRNVTTWTLLTQWPNKVHRAMSYLGDLYGIFPLNTKENERFWYFTSSTAKALPNVKVLIVSPPDSKTCNLVQSYYCATV